MRLRWLVPSLLLVGCVGISQREAATLSEPLLCQKFFDVEGDSFRSQTLYTEIVRRGAYCEAKAARIMGSTPHQDNGSAAMAIGAGILLLNSQPQYPPPPRVCTGRWVGSTWVTNC